MFPLKYWPQSIFKKKNVGKNFSAFKRFLASLGFLNFETEKFFCVSLFFPIVLNTEICASHLSDLKTHKKCFNLSLFIFVEQ